MIIEGIEIKATGRPAITNAPRRQSSASKPSPSIAKPSVLWSTGLALEQQKHAAVLQAAATSRAQRRARSAEGRKNASERDAAVPEAAAATLIDPNVLTCAQLMEVDGGAFGCMLPAGHGGPHAFS